MARAKEPSPVARRRALEKAVGEAFEALYATMREVRGDAEREVGREVVPEALRGAVGTDLADVYGVTYMREDGGAAELVISQRLIDQLRAAAMK